MEDKHGRLSRKPSSSVRIRRGIALLSAGHKSVRGPVP